MNLYLPVEVKNRELHAKLLLAKKAAERGFNVILGSKNELNEIALNMEPGVYLGLGAFANFHNFFSTLKQRGFSVVVNEEEGLVTYSDSMYVDMRVSEQTLTTIDKLFTWGDENQRVLSEAFPELNNKFTITGNPRFELLKLKNQQVYKSEIEQIKEKYGRYLLICTSFSAINHFDPTLDYLDSLIKKKTLRTPESIENFKRYCEIKKIIINGMLEGIPKLASLNKDVNIVLRPHPSENMEVYREFEQKFSNVHIDARFSVHPWIISADALIHHYCTTSIEALAAGTPRLAMRWAKDSLSEKDIPFTCAYECESVDELVKRTANVLEEGGEQEKDIELRKMYSRYVYNIDDNSAAEALTNEIESLAVSYGFDKKDNNLFSRIKLALTKLRYSTKQFLRLILRRNRKNVSYRNHKFNHLSVNEVNNILEAYEDTGTSIQVRKFAGDFIQLYRTPKEQAN